MKKRVISWLLTVVMVISLLPTSVLADTLAADQEQQTQQEQIAPADTENTVPAEDEETQEQQEPAAQPLPEKWVCLTFDDGPSKTICFCCNFSRFIH